MNSLPTALIDSLRELDSFNEETFKAVHEQGGQVTSIRLNPDKIPNLQSSVFKDQLEKIPWSSQGYYLSQRPSFTQDPLFHAGVYYVQEASSMYLEKAIRQMVDTTASLKILDLCAAPGGKSTHIQSIISKESLLVSNEVIKTRVNILAENMTKWGAANVIVTNNDPKDFQRLENYFDVIVVDAPCSGSGLFRKDPEAISEWSEHNVMLCAQRQQRILADVMPALKDGGILIYSTCSYSQEEDEAIADWLTEELKLESVKLQLGDTWGIVETTSANTRAAGYRFYPDKVKGEGFFIAAFKKYATGDGRNQNLKVKKKPEKISVKEAGILSTYINNAGDFVFIRQQDDVLAFPATLENDLALIQSTLYLKKAGIKIGSIIRDELVPAHDLAVSNIIKAEVPRFDVDLENALQFLRKEEIKIETGLKGWVLLTYQEIPIGWVKIMPNRINNYYPKEWRILNK